jgi:biotin transport system substrate-specific component
VPLPRSSSRDLSLVATFAGVVAALGLVPAFTPPGSTVPITAQSLGVMLAGAVLGARRGFSSVALFILLVALGLPLLAGGRGGLGLFAGPSAGFLLGYPVAALVVGWVTERGGARYRLAWGVVANVIGGILVLYAFGIAGIALVAGTSVESAAVGSLIYLPGDLVKVVVAALVARGVHAAYPGLLGRPRARRAEPTAV